MSANPSANSQEQAQSLLEAVGRVVVARERERHQHQREDGGDEGPEPVGADQETAGPAARASACPPTARSPLAGRGSSRTRAGPSRSRRSSARRTRAMARRAGARGPPIRPRAGRRTGGTTRARGAGTPCSPGASGNARRRGRARPSLHGPARAPTRAPRCPPVRAGTPRAGCRSRPGGRRPPLGEVLGQRAQRERPREREDRRLEDRAEGVAVTVRAERADLRPHLVHPPAENGPRPEQQDEAEDEQARARSRAVSGAAMTRSSRASSRSPAADLGGEHRGEGERVRGSPTEGCALKGSALRTNSTRLSRKARKRGPRCGAGPPGSAG